MKRSRFSEEQIIGVLKEHEAGTVVADLRRKHGMSSPTFYTWKARRFRGVRTSKERVRRPMRAWPCGECRPGDAAQAAQP